MPGITLAPVESIEGRSICLAPWDWYSQQAIMNKATQNGSDRIDWEIRAADALEQARLLPPGPERNEALKLASQLRCEADSQGVVFAKRGRPRK